MCSIFEVLNPKHVQKSKTDQLNLWRNNQTAKRINNWLVGIVALVQMLIYVLTFSPVR